MHAQSVASSKQHLFFSCASHISLCTRQHYNIEQMIATQLLKGQQCCLYSVHSLKCNVFHHYWFFMVYGCECLHFIQNCSWQHCWGKHSWRRMQSWNRSCWNYRTLQKTQRQRNKYNTFIKPLRELITNYIIGVQSLVTRSTIMQVCKWLLLFILAFLLCSTFTLWH